MGNKHINTADHHKEMLRDSVAISNCRLTDVRALTRRCGLKSHPFVCVGVEGIERDLSGDVQQVHYVGIMLL